MEMQTPPQVAAKLLIITTCLLDLIQGETTDPASNQSTSTSMSTEADTATLQMSCTSNCTSTGNDAWRMLAISSSALLAASVILNGVFIALVCRTHSQLKRTVSRKISLLPASGDIQRKMSKAKLDDEEMIVPEDDGEQDIEQWYEGTEEGDGPTPENQQIYDTIQNADKKADDDTGDGSAAHGSSSGEGQAARGKKPESELIKLVERSGSRNSAISDSLRIRIATTPRSPLRDSVYRQPDSPLPQIAAYEVPVEALRGSLRGSFRNSVLAHDTDDPVPDEFGSSESEAGDTYTYAAVSEAPIYDDIVIKVTGVEDHGTSTKICDDDIPDIPLSSSDDDESVRDTTAGDTEQNHTPVLYDAVPNQKGGAENDEADSQEEDNYDTPAKDEENATDTSPTSVAHAEDQNTTSDTADGALLYSVIPAGKDQEGAPSSGTVSPTVETTTIKANHPIAADHSEDATGEPGTAGEDIYEALEGNDEQNGTYQALSTAMSSVDDYTSSKMAEELVDPANTYQAVTPSRAGSIYQSLAKSKGHSEGRAAEELTDPTNTYEALTPSRAGSVYQSLAKTRSSSQPASNTPLNASGPSESALNPYMLMSE
ncbi:dentin sialophosphoprotein-like [Sycon ciliatum]|uniref:dentin sialophosphoprotein-like n=1 Tax=Sycon ciliatum TaxID=27933 RepID=UPI0031F6CFDF